MQIIYFVRNLLTCLVFLKFSCGNRDKKALNINTAPIRAKVAQLTDDGRISDVVSYLRGIENEYKTLRLDEVLPSLYSFLGVALYGSQKFDEAAEAFKKAVLNFPNESRAWINLGEIQVQTFELMDSIYSFERAYKVGETAALPRMIRTKGWSMAWKDMDLYTSELEKYAHTCYLDVSSCVIDSTGGFEYSDIPGVIYKFMTSHAPNSRLAPTMAAAPILDMQSYRWFQPYKKALKSKDTLATKDTKKSKRKVSAMPRLKVGFLSSDFGIHPVATLVRGMIQYLDKRKFEIYCFSIQSRVSWWGQNISEAVEHFIDLDSSKNYFDNALIIASHKIEILIDLNGHTLKSGLSIMAYRAAPIQMTFLGLPTTTAAQFIDYFIGDYVSLPPEHIDQISEKAILMNMCYIVNDYAQTQGAVSHTEYNYRAPRLSLSSGMSIDRLYSARILLATLSNSMKTDPSIFHVWMNVMQGFAGSKMMFMEYAGHETFFANVVKEAAYHGILRHRLLLLPQLPWIDHLISKTAIDLVLDSFVKSAHTTGLDGLWAGVPTITLAGGSGMSARAGESMAHTIENELGVAFSLKDYEDLSLSLMKKLYRSKDSEQMTKQQQFLQAMNSLQDEIEGIVERKQEEEQVIAAETALEGKEKEVIFNGDFRFSRPSSVLHHNLSNPFQTKKKISFVGTKSGSINKQLIEDFPLLMKWRKTLAIQRRTTNLFNTRAWTKQFEYLLEATWEMGHVTQQRNMRPTANSGLNKLDTLYHIFAMPHAVPMLDHPVDVEQVPTQDSSMFPPNVNNYIHPRDSLDYALKQLLEQESMEFDDELEGEEGGDEGVDQREDEEVEGAVEGRNKETKVSANNRNNRKDAEEEEQNEDSHGENENVSNVQKKQSQQTESAQQLQQQQHKKQSNSFDDFSPPFDEKSRNKKKKKLYAAIPNYIYDGRYIFLNIGGISEAQGWLNVNAQNQNNYHTNMKVHIIREMSDLYGITNNTVSAIYSSHTLEHAPFGNEKVSDTLNEWYRVLRPGGLLMVSVPDLPSLARMYLDRKMTGKDRVTIMKMIYGAQSDENDFHFIGFNAELMVGYLQRAGFCSIERVLNFNMGFKDKFDKPIFDTSDMQFKGHFVSLNMIARVCPDSKPEYPFDGFSIDHHSTPFPGDPMKI